MGYRVGCGYVALAGLTYQKPEDVRAQAQEARIPRYPVVLYPDELVAIAQLLGFRVIRHNVGHGKTAAQALKAWQRIAKEEARDIRICFFVRGHFQAAHILKSGRASKVGYFKSKALVRQVWELVPKEEKA